MGIDPGLSSSRFAITITMGTMVKYYTDGTQVPKELEHFVRPARDSNKNIKQGGIIVNGQRQEVVLYEKVPDIDILQTFMQFGGLDK
jgi:hypothetical protein